MSKKSMLNLLLISAICTLVNILAGWVLFDLGGVASIVLSVIFLVNVRKVFGPEAEGARQSCLWNAIVNGSVLVLGGTVSLIVIIVTLGVGALLLPFFQGFICLLNIAFGIWQLVAWSKLKAAVGTTAATV